MMAEDMESLLSGKINIPEVFYMVNGNEWN